MNLLDTGERDVFLISILLVILVFFVGFSTDVTSGTKSLVSLINTATGRNAQGQFANYPQGAALPAATVS